MALPPFYFTYRVEDLFAVLRPPIAPSPTPEGGARFTGRLKSLAGRSGSTNGGDVNFR